MRTFDSLFALPERFDRSGPWLTSLVLSALIAADSVHAWVMLFGSHARSAQLEPQRASGTMQRAPIDVHKIAGAHLFGVFDDPGTQEPKATTANLILAGTIATENPNHGVAIINADDAPSKVYWAGQDVSGALLRSVYLDHVLLDRKGSLEILSLPKLTDSATPKLTDSATEPSGAPRVSRAAAPTAQARASSDEPPAQEDSVQLLPSSTGGIRGFRVVGGREFEALRASGLQPSDLVTAVNGTPLHDPDSFRQSINDNSGSAVLTVMRRGHPTDININISE